MKRPHRLPCLLSSIILLLCLGTGPVRAAEPAAAPAAAPNRQGLEIMLASLPAAAQTDTGARRQATARRGETVDGAIRRTMGDMPFKEAFLRGVFLEINASAVQPGTLRLVAGAALQVPNVSDLRSHLQRVLEPPVPAAQPAPATPAASFPDKRHWVRFP